MLYKIKLNNGILNLFPKLPAAFLSEKKRTGFVSPLFLFDYNRYYPTFFLIRTIAAPAATTARAAAAATAASLVGGGVTAG